jgi:hypothetical protein
MDETLSQKEIGRKTFQGIANRQNDTRFQRRQIRQRQFSADANTPRQTRETDMTVCTSSSIRTMTVGSGISPDLLTPLLVTCGSQLIAGHVHGRSRARKGFRRSHTAGGELHPALKTY